MVFGFWELKSYIPYIYTCYVKRFSMILLCDHVMQAICPCIYTLNTHQELETFLDQSTYSPLCPKSVWRRGKQFPSCEQFIYIIFCCYSAWLCINFVPSLSLVPSAALLPCMVTRRFWKEVMNVRNGSRGRERVNESESERERGGGRN